MNKKRLVITVIAAVVLLALVTTGALLLTRGNDMAATGAIYGTVGVSTVTKPENMDGLTFGLSLAKVYRDEDGDTGSGGGTTITVKDGETVELVEEGYVVESSELKIYRYSADSNYLPTIGDPEVVYCQDIPTTLVWNYSDVLSVVDWSDDYLDDFTDVVTDYECVWSDSCLGQFYSTQINVSYTDDKGNTCYCIYTVGLSVLIDR